MSKDPNQGEGDRDSARRYDNNVREFVAHGGVREAADKAKSYLTRHPTEAADADREAKQRGGTWTEPEKLVGKGRSLGDRVRQLGRRLRAALVRK